MTDKTNSLKDERCQSRSRLLTREQIMDLFGNKWPATWTGDELDAVREMALRGAALSETAFNQGDAHPCDISAAVRADTFQEVLKSLHDLYNLHRVSGSSDKGHGIALAEQRVRDLAGVKR